MQYTKAEREARYIEQLRPFAPMWLKIKHIIERSDATEEEARELLKQYQEENTLD